MFSSLFTIICFWKLDSKNDHIYDDKQCQCSPVTFLKASFDLVAIKMPGIIH